MPVMPSDNGGHRYISFLRGNASTRRLIRAAIGIDQPPQFSHSPIPMKTGRLLLVNQCRDKLDFSPFIKMKRLFLACTPRTGNLWFRKLLASALEITAVAAHSPPEIDWDALPDEFLVAMHWHRTLEMQTLLEERHIDVLVTMRHPLDILISILRFCQFEPATAFWLGGEGGSEAALKDANPTDRRFLAYALSGRAAALFSVSLEWLRQARAVVRYEDLVERPQQTLQEVVEILGEAPAQPLDQGIRSYEISQLRSLTGEHCWLGRPGLWRSVISDEYRKAIYQKHRIVFDAFGYTVAGPKLTAEEALGNWRDLLLHK